MISPPAVDGRRVESFVQELRRFAPHYTPDLNISDPQSAGVALMRIFAQLAEIVAVRLDQAPQKHFVAFLDKLGITLLPARPATVAVTFRLASGFEEAVKVPAGTRVTAQGVEDEIPFETTNELLAIPGVLTTAYGVDPLKDLIFAPPLDFLKQEPRTPSELSYEIQSFVPKGSNRLQLNHITELKTGSYIRIGCKEKHIVQKVDDGNFITLYEPVKADFPENTIVVPIRNFEVFNGIDRQEHVLYIAHENLFTIKEEVEITLAIELKDPQTTLEPLDLVWQFWTKDEEKVPEEEEHWQPLDVKLDGTASLSTTGRIVLVKKKNLEIKPRKVAGRESRWIRAELKDKLPVGSKELPEIETINISVDTPVDAKGDPIGFPADQGFYNATPLDVQVEPGIGFFPFGTEPRQFDQFYIGSKEAFSKKEAAVNLNFDLDLQTLAAPTVVSVTTATGPDILAYSIGLRRRLYELGLNSKVFNLLGNPLESQGVAFLPIAGAIPAVITDSADGVLAFVNTEDTLEDQNPANKIWVNSHRVSQVGSWQDLDAPGSGSTKVRLRFSPAAVRTPTAWPHPNFSRVFVVGVDGKLYSRGFPVVADWFDHGSPTGVTLDSPPFAVVAGAKIFVFVNGAGTVHWLSIELTGGALSAPNWKSLTPKGQPFTAIYRPFAQTFQDGGGNDHAKVFTFALKDLNNAKSGELFECDTTTENASKKFQWEGLGQPTADPITEIENAPDTHAPRGYIEVPGNSNIDEEGKHIFLRGADNRLYERVDGVDPSQAWQNRSRPGDPDLRDSPAVLVNPLSTTTTQIHVFSASIRNSLVKWLFEIVRSSIAAGAGAQGVRFDEARASSEDDRYKDKILEITNPNANRKIIAYDGSLRLARLELPPLSTPPDTTSTCKIKNGEDLGNARDGADRIFVLHPLPVPPVPRAETIHVRVNDNFNPADFYSRYTGLVAPKPAPAVGARITTYVALIDLPTEFQSPEDTGTVPELSWEYWNGRGWLSIRDVTDTTNSLLQTGDVKFTVPKSIEATEVAGQENFWIRARLVGGDYGRETFRIEPVTGGGQKIVSEKSSLHPPKVRQLLISYKAKPVAPEICLTFNNLDYVDQTAAAEVADSHFPPFETLEDQSFTIFFGFDKTFKTGPVRLLIDAAERNINESKPPEFAWSFRKDRKWKELDAEDGTGALMRHGILTLSASEELTRETRFGEALFWIKGSLRLDRALADVETEIEEPEASCGETKEEPQDPCAEPKDETETPCTEPSHQFHSCSCCTSNVQVDDPCAQLMGKGKASTAIATASGEYPPPLLLGVFLNTVWATQGETVTDEIVGSGDGEPNQTHSQQHGDVLEGEDIRIQEALSAEERERIERELGKASVVDREDIGGTWVRWKSVKALFDCGPQDRCYEVDRAAGILRFGDGEHGSTVPAGVDNIRAFKYRTGGGAIGNVKTNDIQSLATAVAGIESVFNPVPAGGGSDKADTDAMLTIGPRRLSHRDRAVSVEDFEELTYEASRQVAKVRCLRTTNLIRAGAGLPDACDPRQLHQPLEERGRVSLIIVPDSPEPRPCPSLQLRRTVKEYLRQRAPSVVAVDERIIVRPPDYVTVSVHARIFVTTLEKAASVETEARTKLEKFLHPVRGGPDGSGWDFGRPVTRSDIFALLERIPDIDRVENLEFRFRDQKNPDRVQIGRNELLASGEHKLVIKKA